MCEACTIVIQFEKGVGVCNGVCLGSDGGTMVRPILS